MQLFVKLSWQGCAFQSVAARSLFCMYPSETSSCRSVSTLRRSWVNSIIFCCRASRAALTSYMRWPSSRESRSLDTAVRSGTPHRTSHPFWHHSARFRCLPCRHRNSLKNHWNTSLEGWLVVYATLLPVSSEMFFTPGLLHSVHRHNTSLHRPLKASLWFVTNLSLRFLQVCCVVGGVVISGLGNSGTIACTAPPSICTGNQCSFLCACRLSQALRTLGLPCLHSVHEVGDVFDPTSLVLVVPPVLFFTDDQRKHCGRCSSRGGEVSWYTLGLCRLLPLFVTRLRYHAWVVRTFVARVVGTRCHVSYL